VSDLVACPTCQTTLRLPPTAATVRCPKCKSLLEVSGPEASPPPPAKPLPFAPAGPKPAAARARARPTAPTAEGGKPRHRPELVDEELEGEQKKAEEAKVEAERKRQVKRELDEMDRQKEDEEDRYEEVKERCRWGRNALQTHRWSLLAYIFSLVLGYMVLLGIVGLAWLFNDKDIFSALFPVLPGFALLVSFGSLIGTGVGFALALRGPKEATHIAIMGLVAVAAQLICLGGSIAGAFTEADEFRNTQFAEPGPAYAQMKVAYSMLGTATNLQTATDSPVRLVFGRIYGQYDVPWLNVVCGLFEFTRLLLVCQLVQRYAELAKADSISGENAKTVTRIFFTLLVFALFRAATCIGFDWFTAEAGWYIGQLIHLVNFEVCFLIIAVRLLTQFRVIDDTSDMLIADRVASKFDTFNEV
jgi:LSD1 subclass zinc finger protein